MNSPSPPPPPDPVATANAQAAANTKAATTQQQLNMVDQSTPYGSVSWAQTGKWGDGTPRFSATTTLSPEEQRNLDQQHQFDNLVNNLGIQQTEKLTGLLAKPVDLNNEATESRLMELGRKRLQPAMDQRRDQLTTELVNRGFQPGTQAYDDEIRKNRESENDAFNQLLLTGRGQAVQEALTERNQPINEITALMSGGQVTQPNFVGTPTASVAAPDVAGLTMDAYKFGPLATYQQKSADRNAMMSGLFSLGGAALGGWGMGGFKKPF